MQCKTERKMWRAEDAARWMRGAYDMTTYEGKSVGYCRETGERVRIGFQEDSGADTCAHQLRTSVANGVLNYGASVQQGGSSPVCGEGMNGCGVRMRGDARPAKGVGGQERHGGRMNGEATVRTIRERATAAGSG